MNKRENKWNRSQKTTFQLTTTSVLAEIQLEKNIFLHFLIDSPFCVFEVVREKPAQIPRLLLKKFVPSIPLHFNLRSLRIRPPFSEFSVTLVCCFQFGGTFQLLFAIFSTTFLRRSETWRASAFDAAVSPAAFASARFLSLTFDSASSAAILSALAMTSCMFPTI